MSRRRLVAVALLSMVAVLVPAGAAAPATVPHGVVVSADPVGWTPHVLDGKVNAVAEVGDLVVVAGKFTQVQAAWSDEVIERHNVFAFDPDTGDIDPSFAPDVAGEVRAAVGSADGTAVFLGGHFTYVDGVRSKGLVLLSLADGQRSSTFTTGTNARVLDMVRQGNRLYIAGTFTKVKGVPRTGLAILDATTGALDLNLDLPVDGARDDAPLSIEDIDVTPSGDRIVVIGNFHELGGLPRSQVAMVDTSTTPATVASWATDRFANNCSSSFPSWVRDVAFSPDGSYFVVVTTGAYFANTLCDTASRWETYSAGSGQQPTWVNYTGGDTLTAVVVTDVAVYVGGHQRWLNNPFAGDRAGSGAIQRHGIAALDPRSGLPYSWNPGRRRGVGVFALVATSRGLWMGSDTEWTGGEHHARLALFPTAGGSVIPGTPAVTLPTDLHQLGRFDSQNKAVDEVTRRSFDGSSWSSPSALPADATDWTRTRGAFEINDRVFYGWSDGHLYVSDFDGTVLSSPVRVVTFGLTTSVVSFANATGMFFDAGRVYYTIAGDPRLYWRWFQHENELLGAQSFVASGAGDGLDWRDVQGMTVADGRIFSVRSDGRLHRVDLVAGRPVPATAAVVSNSAHELRARAWFTLP